MRRARDEGHGGLCVLCRVGPYLCAVRIEDVFETMRPLPVEPLAGTPSFVAGVAVVRGEPTPVIDAARLLGGSSPSKAGRFLTLRTGGRSAVLSVSSVLGVRALSSESFDGLPPLLGASGLECLEGIGALDADLFVVLASARLVPDAVWAALDRASVP